MTPNQFRSIALKMPGTVEGSHMANTDFRAGGTRGRIFASLWPDGKHAMVKLTPEQQNQWIRSHPDVFSEVKGQWGQRGATQVMLKAARAPEIRTVMTLAWINASER